MSILFATPCYGGMCNWQFARAVAELRADLTVAGLPHDYLWMSNESLIQRARNNCAATFLETDFERLMFIDSDIEFTSDDVAALWNLDADVAVGLYPMKRLDAPTCAWVEGKEVKVEELDGPTEVDYAGTGFMMIKREVLEVMKDMRLDLVHVEGFGDTTRESFAWFNPRVFVRPDENIYLSEDYAFCKDARSRQFKIVADPSINLTHHGSYAYCRGS